MRRNRVRLYTIDAENEEEFNKKCDIALKNELSNNRPLNKENIQEINEEKNIKINNDVIDNQKVFKLERFEDNLSDDDFGDENDTDDFIDMNDEKIVNQDEKNIELLCLYLKQSITVQAKEKNNFRNDNIFYRCKNPLHALSGNAIYDLNVKELVDEIMSENDLGEKTETFKSDDSGKPSSLKEFISKNIKEDCTLKIMFMSNSDSTRNLYIQKFLEINNNNENHNIKKNISDIINFEIRKKQIRLFNKNISLQIFDTSNEFHNNLLSKVYYQFSSGFFIFVEGTNNKVKKYLENIFEKLEKYLIGKTIIIFGVNMLFEQDCTIDGFNLREYASNKNCLYIPIKINDFTLKNNIILNILYLLLIKKIDNRNNSLRKDSIEDKNVFGIKNNLTQKINNLSSKKVNDFLFDISKMNIPNSLGYQKDYRINHLNAFDTENENIFSKRKIRKWSGA